MRVWDACTQTKVCGRKETYKGKMSDEVMFFGEDVLNRVSFLRDDAEFISLALKNELSVFIPFTGGEGLLDIESHDLYMTKLKDSSELAAIIDKILPLIGTKDGRMDHSGVNLTFMGIDERKADIVGALNYKDKYRGVAYFGIDVRYVEGKTLVQASDIKSLTASYKNITLMEMITLLNRSASLYSHAKMYLDWLYKFKFCPGCGSVIYPIQAGTKLQCGNEDIENTKCNVRDARVNNICFPRTDASVIIAIVSRDFSKICLARSNRKIKDDQDNEIKMYSTIAGFMEPSELIENACSREIWEETGITCPMDNIMIIKSQPWPYPVCLMVGCVGIVDFNYRNEIIDLNNDKELQDAQWFDTKELAAAIENNKESGFFVNFTDDLKIPNKSTVAYQLIDHVCKQYKANL